MERALNDAGKDVRAEFADKLNNASEADWKKLRDEMNERMKTVFAAKLNGVLSQAQKDALAKAKAKWCSVKGGLTGGRVRLLPNSLGAAGALPSLFQPVNPPLTEQ